MSLGPYFVNFGLFGLIFDVGTFGHAIFSEALF